LDIKSKSFKYSYFVKTTAVMLAFSLVFIAGYSAFSLYRSEVIFADDGSDNLIATPSFLYNISEDLRVIAAFTSFNKNLVEDREAFAAENIATKTSVKNLTSDRELALELFDIIQTFKTMAPEKSTTAENIDSDENYDYYTHANSQQSNTGEYTYATDIYEQALTAPVFIAPNWSSRISDKGRQYYEYYTASKFDLSEAKNLLNRKYRNYEEWYSYYQLLRRYIFTLVNDARSHDTINAEYDEKIRDMIQLNWENYQSEYYYYENRISSMVNVFFTVVNIKTGEIYTNIDKDNFNLDSFKASLGESLFHINYSAKQGLIDGGIPEKSEATDTIVELFGYTFGAPTTSDAFNNNYLKSYFGDEFDAYIMLPKELSRGDVYHYIYQNYQNINENKTLSLSTVALLILLSAIPTVYLIITAGRKSDDSLSLAAVDKIPFIIHLMFSAGVIIGLFVLVGILASFEFNNAFYDTSLFVILSAVYSAVPAAVGILLGLSYLTVIEITLSFTRLIKTKQLYRNTLLYNIIKIFKFFIKLATFPFTKTFKRKLTWGIIAFLLLDAVLFFLTAFSVVYREAFIVFFFLSAALNISVFVATAKYLSGLNLIAKLAEEMKSGNYDVPLDIYSLPKSLRKTAGDIIDVRSSIQLAVNDRLKGERMKTELITNVSHDLKTPLTSIINYVDLLKKCSLEDEDSKKYLEVLDEKSKRLKHLIEDLTEASKASTGNIKINHVPIDLSELALQALGEHSDVLENAGLEAVYHTSETHPIVYADSQHTWRIIDNLFSNVKKYTQTGTRIYIDVFIEGNYGVFSMKNISKTPLNIPASELAERFVRGDSSRTGEGSGLGLSIAQSLCELQSGRFLLEIDGDLFKASVKLPLYADK